MLKFVKDGKTVMKMDENGECEILSEELKQSFEDKKRKKKPDEKDIDG